MEGTPVVMGTSVRRETTGAKNMKLPTTRMRQHSIEVLFAFLRKILSETTFVQPEQSPHKHPAPQSGHPHFDGVF
jgi:hypothetical protein